MCSFIAFNLSVVFLDNFIKPESGGNEMKHFQTKNRIIHHTTNLKEHSNIHTRYGILSKLERY